MTAYELHLSLCIHRALDAGFPHLAAALTRLLERELTRKTA